MMKYEIRHDSHGRMRLRCGKWLIDEEEGRGIRAGLLSIEGVKSVVVRPANGSILVEYRGSARPSVLGYLDGLDLLRLPTASEETETDLAALDNRFYIRLGSAVAMRAARRLLLPMPVRRVFAIVRAFGYVGKGLRKLSTFHIGVEVLDAVAISAAILRGQFATAASVMFLLKISDILMDYTRERTRAALKHNLALFAETVWLVRDGVEVEVAAEEVRENDLVRVRTGSLVPIDGEVIEGEGSVNEASMTGESALVLKHTASTVYAGTVLEEGSLLVRASADAGASRIDSIVEMVENSQDLKAEAQGRAEHLADAMVPVSLVTFIGVLLVTRNPLKALSVLMVDYSCAIKLATPVAVMSAMREATKRNVVVKGGRYLEALAFADTIVFDKTGTLTEASPVVEKVLRFNGISEDEILRLAACLEEHFPHSMARAIVRSARDKGLAHAEENHAEVDYIVAHGIVSSVDGRKVRIGSAHFIFEDEGVARPDGLREIVEKAAPSASTVFLSIGDELAGALCISDPLRPEAAQVIADLRSRGFERIIMLTGDSENCARAVADKLGIDEYRSQVLPEDKAAYVESLKAEGATVAMVGDGINDSPALAAADVSIALSDASDIARAVADVSVLRSSLTALPVVRDLAVGCMSRIDSSYRFIVSFNTALIVAGIVGLLQPSASALLHNASTILLTASNTRPLLPEGGAHEKA